MNEDFSMPMHAVAKKTKINLPWLTLELIYSPVTCVHRMLSFRFFISMSVTCGHGFLSMHT